MRILLANTTAYPSIGGVENSLRFIGRELISAGHEVKIFCLRMKPGEPSRMEHEGIEILRYPCRVDRWPHRQHRNSAAAAEKGISEAVRSFRPDAVWSRNVPVGLGIRRGGYRGPMLQIFPTTAKLNCRGHYLETRGLPFSRRIKLLGLWLSAYPVSSRFERELSGRCAAVVFSENMRRLLLGSFWKESGSCHLVRPGVDGDLFSPENGARFFDTINEKYGLSGDEPFILFVGRLSAIKRIPLLMDAVRVLDRPVKLVLVGSGLEESRLREYARRTGIAGRVIFAGSQHMMLPGFYAMSRVCVMPTTLEPFGQTYLESLASGTPAVGFRGDGCRVLTATDEIVREGETGTVVDKVDAESLAGGIGSILALQDDRYRAMSRLCREDVIGRFSWKRFVAGALELTETQRRERAQF